LENGVTTDATSDPELSHYLQQFWEAVDYTRTARQNSERYRDYYDGKQWTDSERQTLQKRRQPCITDNRIKDKVDHLCGMERQTRTDPKAYPRNPQDEGASAAATDALRYVADCNDFPQVKSKCFDNMLVEGFGGCEVVVEKKGDKNQVKIRNLRWDRTYFDPHSLQPDFSDSLYMGVVLWLDVGVAKKKYPNLANNFDRLMDGQLKTAETYDDKPEMWCDRKRKRVQILEHYHRNNGTWHRVVFSRAGIIEPSAPSVYVNEYGEPECPLILQAAYVERNGDRYGIVRRYMDLQDEINKRRSKTLHLLNTTRAKAEKGALADVEKARTELARPDGIVEFAPGMVFEVQENRDLASGQFLLLQEALTAISVIGPNSALQGEQGDQSGRAQQVAQQAGVVQLGPLFDGVRYWQKRVMRAAWNRVRQFWTDETWIRVTDDEKTHFVALNRPMTVGEIEAEKLKGAQIPEQEKMQRLQQLASNPQSMQQVVQNNVAEMDMDIIIDEAPDTVTLQQEQWGQLTELAKSGFPIPPKTLIRASSLRNKEQLIDEMESQQTGIPPQVQEQMQQAQQEIQQKAEQLAQEEQQLKDLQNQIKEQATALKAERAELEATRKVFAAEVKVAHAELGAERVQAEAQIQSKTVTANAQLQNKQTQIQTKQAQFQAKQSQAKKA
jgi:hypothetical protein